MSSVLHPVGPEPEERYWLRRLGVIVGLAALLAVVIALVVNATSAGSAVQAAPSAPPPVAPAPAISTPAPTLVTPTPTPSAPTPTPRATPTKSPTPTPTPTKSATKKPVAKKPVTKKPAVLPACPTGDLRSTLTGPRKAKLKAPATFALSVINGSEQPCYVRVTADNFRLTIVSGSDRIWTTADCAKVVPTASRELAREQALEWKVRWDGSRSRSECRTRPEAPQAGTYWAIAQFDDAEPVRWRMVLS